MSAAPIEISTGSLLPVGFAHLGVGVLGVVDQLAWVGAGPVGLLWRRCGTGAYPVVADPVTDKALGRIPEPVASIVASARAEIYPDEEIGILRIGDRGVVVVIALLEAGRDRGGRRSVIRREVLDAPVVGLSPGRFAVPSTRLPGFHEVLVDGGAGGYVDVLCSCAAGRFSAGFAACWHAQATLARLGSLIAAPG